MRDLLALLSVVSIGASALFLIYGVALIKRGRRRMHHRVMLIAAGLAALFLVFYLAKTALYGGRHYAGPEAYHAAYLVLLAFHSLIAALNLPLVLVVLYLAFAGRFDRHRRLAPFAVANWLLVALTGWLVWYMLLRYGK